MSAFKEMSWQKGDDLGKTTTFPEVKGAMRSTSSIDLESWLKKLQDLSASDREMIQLQKRKITKD